MTLIIGLFTVVIIVVLAAAASTWYDRDMMIKFLYSLFLGILVALFIGLGIAAFYEAPKAPEYPVLLETRPVATEDGKVTETEEQKAARLQYDKEQKQYQEDFSAYNRNVSIIAMISAVIVLVVSLTLTAKIQLISDGLLLGGVFTLLYSVIRGFMAEDTKYRFIVVAVGLIASLIIGYLKFIRHEEKK